MKLLNENTRCFSELTRTSNVKNWKYVKLSLRKFKDLWSLSYNPSNIFDRSLKIYNLYWDEQTKGL